MNILPAPERIEHEIEVFGTYEKYDKKYNFHLWMEKGNENEFFGKVFLPFTCITENKMLCVYKSENNIEEGGKSIQIGGICCNRSVLTNHWLYTFYN